MIKSIEMVNIVKEFPLVRAVDHVSFTINAGEVHSLLGENGAGKTCLMKTLYGMFQPEEGEIRINGESIKIKSPKDAIRYGIGMVHQHFMLSPVLSVTENIIVGAEPVKNHIFIDYNKAAQEVQELIDKYHFNIDANALVETLSVGEQQRVEILKAIYRGARILILDEPTAVLTPQEVEKLFVIIRRLKEAGTGIVIITHKLKETLAIADVISVLRFGKLMTHSRPLGNATVEELANLMVGREVELNIRSDKDTIGDVYFQAENLSLAIEDISCLKNVSFEIHKGEILGIAGVEGNGQTPLIEVLTGLRKADSGRILKNEKEVKGDSFDFIENRIGHIPEDRLTRGLITQLTINQNLILGYHHREAFTDKKGFLKKKDIESYSNKAISDYAIKTPNGEQPASSLSGGNQQKIVVARVMEQDPDVLIIAQPTRGVDVGATEYIHRQILGLKEKGKAVLLISADLDEVMNLSDRIAVFYDGSIVKTFDSQAVSVSELGLAMAGVVK